MGVVEVGEDVPGSAFEYPARCDDLSEGARDARIAEMVYFGLDPGLARTCVGRAVCIDDVLVDAPGDFEGDVAIAGEQVGYLVLLARRELVSPGVEHTVGLVQGIRGTPTPMVTFLPGAPAALIESITGEVHDVDGIHDRGCVWEFFGGCALKTGESIHLDDLHLLAPGVRVGGQLGCEDPLGAARDHVQEP